MTTTSTGATIHLHSEDAAEEVPEPRAEEYLDSVFDLDAKEEDPFDSLDAMLALEEAETEGRRVKWDLLPDAWVHIAHLSAAVDKRDKLERKLREKKGWTYSKYPKGALPGDLEEKLWRAGMFETAVKGWGGESFKNRPFTERNFLRLMDKSRRFRSFVLEHTGTVDDLRRKVQEDAAGN